MTREPTAATLARYEYLKGRGFEFEKSTPYTLILYVGLRDPYTRSDTILLVANELRDIATMPPGLETLWGKDRFKITYDLADMENVECPDDNTADDETGPVIREICFRVVEYLYSYFYHNDSELKNEQVVITRLGGEGNKRTVVEIKRLRRRTLIDS